MENNLCKTLPKDILPPKKKIIVIGDIHADFKNLFKLFLKLKLIDINKRWIAKPLDTVVIQVGDQLDGGGRFSKEESGENNILDFMEFIHEQAIVYGGGVYSLIGNHELMNVLGDFRYASKKDIEDNLGVENRKKLYSQGGKLAMRLSCTRNVVMKIGSFLFAHAGVLPKMLQNKDLNKDSNKYLNKDKMIQYLNNLMRDYLQNKKVDEDAIDKYFKSSNSILWNREYGNVNNDNQHKKDKNLNNTCKDLNKVLDYFSVNGMIIGHTPQKEISSACNKKLWKVDVGISDAFNIKEGYKLQVLEIIDDGKEMNTLTI